MCGLEVKRLEKELELKLCRLPVFFFVIGGTLENGFQKPVPALCVQGGVEPQRFLDSLAHRSGGFYRELCGEFPAGAVELRQPLFDGGFAAQEQFRRICAALQQLADGIQLLLCGPDFTVDRVQRLGIGMIGLLLRPLLCPQFPKLPRQLAEDRLLYHRQLA